MGNCGTCRFYRDLSFLDLGTVCLKESNFSLGMPLKVSTCDSCLSYAEQRSGPHYEWDETKNQTNKAKHGLSFEFATEVLKDEHQFQLAEFPEKWEKIDISSFEEKGIPKNAGNISPVRGKIICCKDDEFYTVVYTHRGDLGDLALRIISFRKADKKEKAIYQRVKNQI